MLCKLTSWTCVTGFGLCGTPNTLIQALAKRPEVTKLTGVSNNAGVGDKGLGEPSIEENIRIQRADASDCPARSATGFRTDRQDDRILHWRVSQLGFPFSRANSNHPNGTSRNKEFEKQYLTGKIDVELTPQGTLAERIRAAGAGIPAFFTATGYGTPVQDGSVAMRNGPDGKVSRSVEVNVRHYGSDPLMP